MIRSSEFFSQQGIKNLTYNPEQVKAFGTNEDGVIELVTKTAEQGVSESGIYFGSVTHPDYPVFAISSATGCQMRCLFCDLGALPAGKNLNTDEIFEQLSIIGKEAVLRGVNIDDGFKVNFAKTGESLFNPSVSQAIQQMTQKIEGIRFKVSSVFPASKIALKNFELMANMAGNCPTSIQIQASLISTSEEYRQKTAGKVASFSQISEMASFWRSKSPRRSQFNLSMILSEETPCDPSDILPYFDPEHFRIRLRDCIPTDAAQNSGLKVITEERFQDIYNQFTQAGYFVSLDGRPTETERTHSLASNATRRNILTSD